MNRPTGRPHRTLIVSFSGVDGAGKSTQISALRRQIELSNIRVWVRSFWNDVSRLKSLRESSSHKLFKGDRGVGSPERPLHRRDKNIRTWYLTLFRLFVYFLDTVSLQIVVSRLRQSDVGFIIFDRYLYDELANLPLNNGLIRTYLRGLLKLAPKPDVAFLLDADPVAACNRKPEYPIEFVHTNRAAYLSLVQIVQGLTVIEPLPPRDVEIHVMREIAMALQGAEFQGHVETAASVSK